MADSVNLNQLLADYKENEELFLLDPGEYEFEILTCKVRATDFMPTLKVASGPYQGKRVMFGVFSYKGNSSGIFFRNMRGLGLDESYFKTLAAQTAAWADEVGKALIGRRFTGTVVHDEWNGEMRNKLVPGTTKLTFAPPLTAVGGIPAAAVQAAPVAAVPTAAAPVSVPVAAPVAVAAPQVQVPQMPQVPAAPVAAPIAAPVQAIQAAPLPAPVAPLPQPTAEQIAAYQAAQLQAQNGQSQVEAVPAAVPAAVTTDDEPGF